MDKYMCAGCFKEIKDIPENRMPLSKIKNKIHYICEITFLCPECRDKMCAIWEKDAGIKDKKIIEKPLDK